MTNNHVQQSDLSDEDYEDIYYSLVFDTIRNINYSEIRYSFYRRINTITIFINIAFGSAVISNSINNIPYLQFGLSVFFVFMQALNISYNTQYMANLYNRKTEKFYNILHKIEDYKIERRDMRSIRPQLLDLYADDPVKYYCADAMAWNFAYLATTRHEEIDYNKLYRIRFYEKLTMNLLPYSHEFFRKRKKSILNYT